jgi:hypothetical protein
MTEREGFVYIVSEGNFAKIGHTTNPSSRQSSLRNANPNELELLALFPGGAPLAQDLRVLPAAGGVVRDHPRASVAGAGTSPV